MEPIREFTEQEIEACVEQMQQPKFLFVVAFHITTQLIFRLVERGHTEHLTMIEGIPFYNLEMSQHVDKTLKLDIDDRPMYWRKVAEEVLSKGGIDGLADENKASSLVLQVASRLLSDIRVDSLLNHSFIGLLGIRQQEEIEALHKLSKTQKLILIVLRHNAMRLAGDQAETEPIPWKPDILFLNLTHANRVGLSKSLQRLSERGLVQRLDVRQKIIPVENEQSVRRTAFVTLTELGFLVASRIAIQAVRLDQ